MSRPTMVIDLTKCVGCYACTVACQIEHDLPPLELWNKVYCYGPVGEYPHLTSYYLSRPCMHCQDPPCVDACPTGASYINEEGLVLVDEKLCVGCKFCMLVCPYDVRVLSEEAGVVRKCTFCPERLAEGKLPRCVETCALGARYFGDLEDTESEVYDLVYHHNAVQLLPELGTNPSVYYIFP